MLVVEALCCTAELHLLDIHILWSMLPHIGLSLSVGSSLLVVRHASTMKLASLGGLTLYFPLLCSGQEGKAKGLPAGIKLSDLRAEKVERIPPTHDEGNPLQTSEFFDTRQVQNWTIIEDHIS